MLSLEIEFKDRLRRIDFRPYKDESLEKLAMAVRQITRESGGATWFRDFNRPLYRILREQYDCGEFLPFCGERRKSETYYGSIEDKEKALREKLEKRARAMLAGLYKYPRRGFDIANTYQFFREFYDLKEDDEISLSDPELSVEDLQRPETKERLERLSLRAGVNLGKAINGLQTGRYFRRSPREEEFFDAFLEGNILSPSNLDDHKGLDYRLAEFGRNFKNLLGHAQIAYTNDRAAKELTREYFRPKPKQIKKVYMKVKI